MAQEWADQLMEDHERSEQVFDAVRTMLETDGGPEPGFVEKMLDYFAGYVDSCHNKKEENHLFPLIEERGVPRQGGPLAVMLSEHEQSRELLAKWRPLAEAYAGGDRSVLDELRTLFGEYSELLKNHFWKENDILYPMAKRVLSDEDAAQVLAGIEEVEASVGKETRKRFYALADELLSAGQVRDLIHDVEPELVAGMLNTLPVELSLVDADDTVRYFNHENEKKIFPRSRGVIGMKVHNCHPKKSVHMVEQILSAFKAGERDVAEFWLPVEELMVHIRYFAIRGAGGRYLGCVEMVQDVAPLKKIEGQRRLLEWE
ncbi:MAG: DUF438 domain-containing protein [Deltaproteobacteria bacterium]|jgi:DUF438 domain-containing protein|nr:DUF438 domain-containing protein [Deltaproteobacteria bacterium]MBW2536633.1 DUF438 domain-containing protein [Deltaproteobacteria bacterium]